MFEEHELDIQDFDEYRDGDGMEDFRAINPYEMLKEMDYDEFDE